jgi:hypothetical protein
MQCSYLWEVYSVQYQILEYRFLQWTRLAWYYYELTNTGTSSAVWSSRLEGVSAEQRYCTIRYSRTPSTSTPVPFSFMTRDSRQTCHLAIRLNYSCTARYASNDNQKPCVGGWSHSKNRATEY